jgi:OpgC protein
MHENFGAARTAVLAGPGKRDLRLDLLRGIGQWMVFLDHIPYNFLNWFTLRNYAARNPVNKRARPARLACRRNRPMVTIIMMSARR